MLQNQGMHTDMYVNASDKREGQSDILSQAREQHLTQRNLSPLSRCCRGSACLLRSCRAKGEVESAEMG